MGESGGRVSGREGEMEEEGLGQHINMLRMQLAWWWKCGAEGVLWR